ncbi:MAG TPA: TonB C-terminal domain-containing protein [Burkholderiales bacterium]|nr:TonB C-terminal domain-containing protein [Burkholderiales bacterium]
MTAAVFEERSDPGQLSSALLSAAMHLVLLAVLVFGVRWQSRPPEAVQVELWEPPAPVAAAEAPKPAPAPVVEPPPAPRPEPVVPKPEIVERKAEKPKPAPKPVAKAEPLKPKVDETKKRMREQLAREEASLAVERESQMLKDLAARQAASAGSKAQAAWIDKVKAKIRGNIVLPPDIKGNPEAVFDVVQLPTGEVLPPVKLKKSSGIAALDAAIERAVLKSSPLPRPDGGYTAPRDFELKYKPLE